MTTTEIANLDREELEERYDALHELMYKEEEGSAEQKRLIDEIEKVNTETNYRYRQEEEEREGLIDTYMD